jgi:hypothetical protein
MRHPGSFPYIARDRAQPVDRFDPVADEQFASAAIDATTPEPNVC